MNIIHKVTWQSMWKNRTRTLVTIISVVLSAAMFMAAVTLVYSIWDFLVRGYEYASGDYYVEFDYVTNEQYEALKAEPDVRYAADFKVLGYHDIYYATRSYEVVGFGCYPIGAVCEAFLEHMSIPLAEGRLPENSGEIVIPRDYNERCLLLQMPTLSVGDTVTLSMFNYISAEIASSDRESEETFASANGMSYQEFEKTFTVVGIMEDRSYSSEDTDSDYKVTMLTISDGNEGEAFWHKLYVKTKTLGSAYELAEKEYGENSYLYQELLNMYGGIRKSEEMVVLAVLAVILIVIIVVASISPIRNAFAISVSERTFQFGLLSGIGATKKQIRRSVQFEAAVVAGIGIPVGILIGYFAMAIVLRQYGTQVIRAYQIMAYGATGSGVELVAVPSMIALLVTILICVGTVFFSVRKSARRATKITPLEAIRQSQDIRTRSARMRVGKITQKLFGLPGILAKKYYRTSRKKYRATVVSITVSIVLFVGVNYLADSLNLVMELQRDENFDFSCYLSGNSQEEMDEEIEFAKNVPGIVRSAVVYQNGRDIDVNIPADAYTDGYKDYVELRTELSKYQGYDGSYVKIYYLEDEVFEEHLRAEGIDPTPYLNAEEPLAVTMISDAGFYEYRENGEQILHSYYGPWLKEEAQIYFSNEYLHIPDELYPKEWNEYAVMTGRETRTDGTTVIKATAAVIGTDGKSKELELGAFLTEFEVDEESGKLMCHYYAYDVETEKRGELLLTKTSDTATIRIGEALEVRPFGIDYERSYCALIMPVSQMPEDNNYAAYVRLKSDDYATSAELLLDHEAEEEDFSCEDMVRQNYSSYITFEAMRFAINSLTLIISLVGAANVFNTITANISLRRRDFGMLKSIGMTAGDIDRMISFECLSYGTKSLAIGLPIGLATCYITYYYVNKHYHTGVGFPWLTVCLGSLVVFLIVFASAFYAVARMRRDNPIDAIRMDNL